MKNGLPESLMVMEGALIITWKYHHPEILKKYSLGQRKEADGWTEIKYKELKQTRICFAFGQSLGFHETFI